MKQIVVEATIDPGSKKIDFGSYCMRDGAANNSSSKTSCLGMDLEEWTKLECHRTMHFKFAITSKYIDEVACEVIPLGVCEVILRYTYRDVIFHIREQKY